VLLLSGSAFFLLDSFHHDVFPDHRSGRFLPACMPDARASDSIEKLAE
jgi:hypothetical protein